MSRIYFHSEHGEAELQGPERAAAARLCHDLVWVALGSAVEDYPGAPSPLRPLLPSSSYVASSAPKHFASTLKTWLRTSDDAAFLIESQRVGAFPLALNTALVMGSDPVKLMARLHGQCEMYAYVEGPNRAWLASTIEQGRADGIMRANLGWESVVDLLRARTDCPVVTSYSVSEGFPNSSLAIEMGTHAPTPRSDLEWWEDDEWENLLEQERWSRSIDALRLFEVKHGPLELKPDNWQTMRFKHRLNGFDICRIAGPRRTDELA